MSNTNIIQLVSKMYNLQSKHREVTHFCPPGAKVLVIAPGCKLHMYTSLVVIQEIGPCPKAVVNSTKWR